MANRHDQRIFRIVDANFNRAREGLRVCEDICRFLHDQRIYTRRFKALRHRLTACLTGWDRNRLLAARDVGSDTGRVTICAERRRRDWTDIFDANIQRAKESVRVLEEVTKLADAESAESFKKLRYDLYALEQKARPVMTSGGKRT